MGSSDWIEVIGAIGIFVLVTTVITVTIWQLAATWRAKAVHGREEAYRRLVESVARGQENTERQLAALAERVAVVDTRLANLERILHDVE